MRYLLSKDQAIGALVSIVCITAAVGYTVALFFPQYMPGSLEPTAVQLWVVAVPVFIAFLTLLAIGAWIGWTMATTSPSRPVAEAEAENACTGEELDDD